MSERTLTEYAKSICALVEADTSTSSVDEEVTSLAGMADEIEDLAQTLDDRSALARLFIEADLMPPDTLASARQALRVLDAHLGEEPLDLRSARQDVLAIKQRLPGSLKDVQRDAQQCWSGIVEAARRQLPTAEVLAILRATDPEPAQRLEECSGRLEQLANALPRDVTECGEPEELRKEVASLVDRTDAIPSEVRDFLLAVEDGITLDAISPDVLDWLRAKGLLAQYIAVPRGHFEGGKST